jgi:cytochrome P450
VLRDPVTGDLTLGSCVTAVTSRAGALAVLRDGDRFLQWDGSFRTPAGDLVSVGEQPGETVLVPISSVSSLTPDCDTGPYCFAQTPVFLDGPRHARFRRLLAADWMVETAGPPLAPLLRRRARELLAGAGGRTAFEFMRSVATRLSAEMLAAFFGGAAEEWSGLTLRHPSIWGKPADGDSAIDLLGEFQQHIWREMMDCVRGPADNAISRMILHHLAGDGLRLGEIHTVVLQMAVVANESVIRMLGSVARALAANPRARRELSGDDKAMRRFQGEILRMCPPIRGVYRRTISPSSAGGIDVPADHGVFVDLRLAGQDGAGPGERGHLAFGAGVHGCPGARLALTAGSALTAALCELPVLKVCEGGLSEVPSGLLEGPSELWLEAAAP